jgi:hypothetical protein
VIARPIEPDYVSGWTIDNEQAAFRWYQFMCRDSEMHLARTAI